MHGTPDICPNCGAEVPPDAKACPGCGADEETGWGRDAQYADLDLPDDNFDYEAFVKREFASPSPKPETLSWFWWIIAIVVLLALLFLWVL
jgi:hypothetical protein